MYWAVILSAYKMKDGGLATRNCNTILEDHANVRRVIPGD
jgi:hypothetical protein